VQAWSAWMGTSWRSQIRMILWARAAVGIVRVAGQCRRGPRHCPAGHLHLNPGPAVFAGEVGPAAAGPVAFGEGALEQDGVRVGFAQGAQHGRRAGRRRLRCRRGRCRCRAKPAASWARVSCRRRCPRAARARRCGGSLQRRSPSRVTVSMVTHSAKACGRSSAAAYGTNAAPVPAGRDAAPPPNGTGVSCVAGSDPLTRSVATFEVLSEPLPGCRGSLAAARAAGPDSLRPGSPR
jgi:hypothetical protein